MNTSENSLKSIRMNDKQIPGAHTSGRRSRPPQPNPTISDLGVGWVGGAAGSDGYRLLPGGKTSSLRLPLPRPLFQWNTRLRAPKQDHQGFQINESYIAKCISIYMYRKI